MQVFPESQNSFTETEMGDAGLPPQLGHQIVLRELQERHASGFVGFNVRPGKSVRFQRLQGGSSDRELLSNELDARGSHGSLGGERRGAAVLREFRANSDLSHRRTQTGGSGRRNVPTERRRRDNVRQFASTVSRCPEDLSGLPAGAVGRRSRRQLGWPRVRPRRLAQSARLHRRG